MVAGAALIQRHTVRLASRYTRAWSVRTSSVRPFVRARRRTSAMATADRRVRVAVVGGGAAGLAAAKELRAEGHTPVVFEQGTDVGGVWVYDPRVESDDVTGTDPSRAKVHGSMYASLRTNLPREVMGYPSFPFTKVFAGDDRRFCGHGEVRAYLAAYAEHHELSGHINTSTEVVKAEPIHGSVGERLRRRGLPMGPAVEGAHTSRGWFTGLDPNRHVRRGRRVQRSLLRAENPDLPGL